MIYCSVCGRRTWNYEGGKRICVNGHKTTEAGRTTTGVPVRQDKFWRWRFAFVAAWLLTIGVIVATELAVK